MSDMTFNLWRNFIIEEAKVKRLSRNSDAVIAITNFSRKDNSNLVLGYLLDNPFIFLMEVRMIEGGIQFFHHTQEVTVRLGSNLKCKVGLQGWGEDS